MRTLPLLPVCLVLTACLPAADAGPPPAAKVPAATLRRIAFLGDSITDGNTYPLLVRSAFQGARLPAPVAINAGIGSDTAAGMAARLDRDVLAFGPTLVTLSVGANDAVRGVPPGDYERDVRAIAARLRKQGAPLVLLTPCLMTGEAKKKAGGRLAGYEASLRRVAAEGGLRVAEVGRLLADADAAGRPQIEADGVHPNYEGQRTIARAVLDALGYPEVTVPPRPEVEPLPGILKEWAVRVLPKGVVLTDGNVRFIKPKDFPTRITLPEADPADQPWADDFRKQGGAVSTLKAALGPDGPYVGRATLHSDARKPAQIHVGADLGKVWLNGRLVYEAKQWRGFHAGRESASVELKAGDNTFVIQTGPVFFLSVTDGPMWPPDPR